MYQIRAQRVRGIYSHRSASRGFGGYLMALPELGNNLVIFRESDNRRFVSTEIARVLGDTDVIFVETANSVYRIEIVGKVRFMNREPVLDPMAATATT